MKNQEDLLKEYLNGVNQHYLTTVIPDSKKANKIFDHLYFDLEKNITTDVLEECKAQKDLNEWQQFWLLRVLYIRTKNEKYLTELENIQANTQDKFVRLHVGAFVRSK